MPEENLSQALAELEASAFHRLQARLAVLRAYLRYRTQHHLSDARAQEAIAEQFSRRTLSVAPWVYDVYDSLSGRTLRRWEKQLEDGGLAKLIDRQGSRSRRSYTGYFDPGTEMRKTAFHYLADHPDCSASELMEELARHFSEGELPDLRTAQRFLARMKA